MPAHRDLIVEQFTKQAVPFSTAPGIRDEEALRLLVEFTGAGPEDSVLDVACGPGLVVCAFAAVARHATGIDLTPAMIERAQALARERKLRNVTWHVGDVVPLPFANDAFSVVVCRFAFHHFPHVGPVLAEMKRVCRPGGTVAVVDVVASVDPAKARAFNRMERLRDPSHVRALTLAEIEALFPRAGLPAPHLTFYRLESELEGLLERSFPDPDDVGEIRRVFDDALADAALGLGPRRGGGRGRLPHPTGVPRPPKPGARSPRCPR